ncbi:MAG: hypothetical protein ACRD0A_02975 [Acidimicrobiales bacterium]
MELPRRFPHSRAVDQCPPPDAFTVAAEAKVFLFGRGIDTGGEQPTKTRSALEIFSKELARRAESPPTMRRRA